MADLTQTPANVSLTSGAAVIQSVVAGETITQGMPVYLSSSKYYIGDKDSAAKADVKGIALTPAVANESFVMALPGSVVDLGATLTVGTTYIVGDAGAIRPIADGTTGEFPTILGTATTASQLPLTILVATVAKA